MTAGGLTRSHPSSSGGKINGSLSRDADAMCLPRGVRRCSENTHNDTHTASAIKERPCKCESVKCHQGCALCRYFQGRIKCVT